jgi:(2Fe-2S) ferredoxin
MAPYKRPPIDRLQRCRRRVRVHEAAERPATKVRDMLWCRQVLQAAHSSLARAFHHRSPRRTSIEMSSFQYHVFVCGNIRAPGHRRGCCDPEGRQVLKDAFKAELKKAGLGVLARANHAGCLDQCEHGPTVVIYPLGVWYGKVTLTDVPRIVSRTILGGEILEDLVIPESCLNNPNCPHRCVRTGSGS